MVGAIIIVAPEIPDPPRDFSAARNSDRNLHAVPVQMVTLHLSRQLAEPPVSLAFGERAQSRTLARS